MWHLLKGSWLALEASTELRFPNSRNVLNNGRSVELTSYRIWPTAVYCVLYLTCHEVTPWPYIRGRYSRIIVSVFTWAPLYTAWLFVPKYARLIIPYKVSGGAPQLSGIKSWPPQDVVCCGAHVTWSRVCYVTWSDHVCVTSHDSEQGHTVVCTLVWL